MPVPQTFTAGLLATVMKCSASPMQTLRLPCPAPSPRTACPSMYAFWLISSFAFWRRAVALDTRETQMMAATFMFCKWEVLNVGVLTG